MRKKSKLVYGVGINDADYPVQKHGVERGKKKQLWVCPFYRKWNRMLERSYSQPLKEKYPTYQDCQTVSEWHYFMTFRAWMQQQDWEGKELDKDILFPSNKIYGPDTCVFVDAKVNSFINDVGKSRGEWPIGVHLDKRHLKFQARCQNVTSGRSKSLGYYDSPQEAHQAWLTFKLEQAKILAAQQADPRVAMALIDRYENFDSYFGENK